MSIEELKENIIDNGEEIFGYSEDVKKYIEKMIIDEVKNAIKQEDEDIENLQYNQKLLFELLQDLKELDNDFIKVIYNPMGAFVITIMEEKEI